MKHATEKKKSDTKTLRCSVAVYTYLNDPERMKLKWEQVGDIYFSSSPTGRKKKG